MRADLLTALDAYWATHLQCSPDHLRSNQTIVLTHSHRRGGSVWLIGRTCLIAAAPPLAKVLKASVGTRAPMQAFEPSRLKSALAHLGVEVHGPEAVLAFGHANGGIHWVSPAELHTLNSLQGISLICLPLTQRAERKLAEARGFELYASVIDLGERVRP